MTPRRIFGALAALLAVYEGVTLANAAPGDTISEIVWALSDRWPVVTFLFGLLAGHWFWPRVLARATAARMTVARLLPALEASSPDRRTEAGALLRSGLDAIAKQAMTVPNGRRGVVAVVVDQHGAEVGAAFLTARGWTVEASVRAAMREGRTVQAAIKVTF